MKFLRKALAAAGAGAIALGLGLAPAAATDGTDAAGAETTSPKEHHLSGFDLEGNAITLAPRDIDVVVMLKDQPSTLSESDESARLATQDQLIAKWEADYGIVVDRQFAYLVNGFSATISSDQILGLSQEPEVESVARERIYYETEAHARDMHGVAKAYADYGVDGAGTVVAIIDSGIDVTHQDMRLDEGMCEIAKLAPDTENGFTCKVPFGYNYADDNWVVHDTTGSDHGMHVAGIVGANGAEGPDAPDFDATGRIDGAAPNAQLLAMKVFSNDGSGGASDGDIVVAIEDSVKLGADVMNLSLGSPNGVANTSDGMARALEVARENGVLPVISAGNSGLNFSQTAETDDIFGLFDDGVTGAPSVNPWAFTVASIDNSFEVIPVSYWYDDGAQSSLPSLRATGQPDGQEWEIVDVGLSQPQDYTADTDLTGKFALIERGGNTFAEKYANAIAHGAEGIVVFNSEAGGNEFVGMGGVEEYTLFSASIYRSDGLAMREALEAGRTVTVQFTTDQEVVPYADGWRGSSFTSWGPTPSLEFKPNIAGIGGSVYSTVNNDQYGVKSGTSMAAPNVSGVSALLVQEFRDRYPNLSGNELADRLEIALQNTADIPMTADGVPLSPRQIGAGLARADLALENEVFATVDGAAEVPLYEVNGRTNFTVTLENFGDEAVTYTVPEQQVIGETNAQWENTTTFISDETLTASASTVTVQPGSNASVTFTLSPNTAEPHYIAGWARFESETAPDLSVPYLGFVGDWNEEPIILPEGEQWFPEVNDSSSQLVTDVMGYTFPLSVMELLNGIPGSEFWLSPNGDGDVDVIAPTLVFMRNASEIKYEVLDENGNLVRTLGIEQDMRRELAMDVLASGGANIGYLPRYTFDGLTWDPAVGNYVAVPDGRYTYRVSARLGEQWEWQTIDFEFGVDNTAPVVEFESFDGETLVFSIIEETSGLANAPTATDSAGAELELTDLGDNRFSAQVTNPDVSHITVSVMDLGFTLGVGTYLVAEDTLAITGKDFLESGVIGPNTSGVADGSLRVQGLASSSITDLSVNDEPVDILSGRWSAFLPLEYGENTFEFVGSNEQGEVDSQTLTVFYDDVPPVVDISNLDSSGTVLVDEGGQITVTGTVTDEREGAELSLKINGEDVALTDGAFEHTFTPAPEALTFPVVASDGVNTTSEAYSIHERVPEVPEWALPTFTNADAAVGYATIFLPNDSPDYNDGVFTLRGEGAHGVGEIIFTPRPEVVDGQYVTPEPIVAVPAADGTFTIDIPVTTGFNPHNLKIVDTAGEVRLETYTRIFSDMVMPTIAFDEPTLVGGTLYANNPEVVFAGTASDDGWGYTLKINDSTILEFFNYGGHGPESNERTFSEVVQVADDDLIQIVFGDAMGNLLVAYIPVILDSEAPGLTFSVADGAVIRDAAPVTTTATDENIASLNVSLIGAEGEVLNETITAELLTQLVPVENYLGEDTGEAVGTLTESEVSELLQQIDTADLRGEYTLTATATDLAGNTVARAVTFTVNDDPVITAPETVDLEVYREVLGDQDALRALVLEQVAVSDDDPIATDPANPAEGETTVDLAEGTVLVEGENAVTVVVTQADGVVVTQDLVVNVSLLDVTLEDDGVTITGKFRSDDSLTATFSNGGTLLEISNDDPYATQRGVITVPADEDIQVFFVAPSGERVPVEAEWADGILTFEGFSRSTFELVVRPTPVDPEDPGTPIDPEEPGEPVQCETIDRPGTMPRGTDRLGEATGDRSADLWSVDENGSVHFYAGNGKGGFYHRGIVMCDQGQITEITPIPDVNDDSRADLLVRHSDGTIHFYYSDGAGFLTKGPQAGHGWNGMDNIVFAGEFAGRDYVVARQVASGDLYRYQLTSRGLSGAAKIGHGWGGMDVILAPGQFTGDSHADLVGISKDGKMFAYKGLRNGTFAGVGQIGHGWSSFTHATIPGDLNGDGALDMVGIRGDGRLFFFENRGNGYWAPSVQVGHGWGGMVVIS
ncbi:S8 family serine peptidase [Trueperella sp.]|uniref:S8 family serine peptidase n=1 Tax=Trueperella sp. TaxID=2699835 RepID=UPI0037369D3D